jgi:hypothetical protein
MAMFIAGERRQEVLLRRALTEIELLHSPEQSLSSASLIKQITMEDIT